MFDEFHEVQAVVLSSPVCVPKINGKIGVGVRKINRHAFGEVGFGNVFCLPGNFFAALDKLLFELGNEGFGALRVHGFERGLRVIRHGIGNHGYGRKNSEQDGEQQFSSEAHSLADMGYGLMISRL